MRKPSQKVDDKCRSEEATVMGWRQGGGGDGKRQQCIAPSLSPSILWNEHWKMKRNL